jgi:protein tyrosine/serine phosphatase
MAEFSGLIKVENGLYRGPRLKLHPRQVNDLKSMGINAIINLQSGMYEKIHDDVYEHTDMLKAYGIQEFTIKCSDFTPPTRKQVEEAISIMQLFNTYVHCLHGKDRTGYIIAAYRMQMCGWSHKAATDEMFEHGFHKFPYLWWCHSLKQYDKTGKNEQV